MKHNRRTLITKALMFVFSYIISFFAVLFVASLVMIPIIRNTGNIIKTDEDRRIAKQLCENGIITDISENDLLKKVSDCENGESLYLYCNVDPRSDFRKYILFSMQKIKDDRGENQIAQVYCKESKVKINPLRIIFKDEMAGRDVPEGVNGGK